MIVMFNPYCFKLLSYFTDLSILNNHLFSFIYLLFVVFSFIHTLIYNSKSVHLLYLTII